MHVGFFKKKKCHNAEFWYCVMFLSIPQKRIIYIVCSYVHAYACLTTPTYLIDRERKIDDVRRTSSWWRHNARHMTSFVIKILVDSDRHEFPMGLFYKNINASRNSRAQKMPFFSSVRYMKEQGGMKGWGDLSFRSVKSTKRDKRCILWQWKKI